jgi:DNA-binding CsgD family transcriptional regulator
MTHKKLVDALGELHAAESPQELMDWTLNRLGKQLGQDFCVWTQFDTQGHLVGGQIGNEVSSSVWNYAPVIQRHLPEHPALRAYRCSGRKVCAMRTSDFISQQKLDETPLFRDAYRHVGARHQICLFFESREIGSASLLFGRNGSEYTDEQVQTVRDLSGHFLIALRRLSRIESLEHALRSPETVSFQAILNGSRWYYSQASGQTSERVAHAFGTAREIFMVPLRLMRQITKDKAQQPIQDQQGNEWMATSRMMGRVLHLILEPSPHQAVLTAFPTLTRREKETAQWISEGKTNSEISQLMGISSKTVDKHVEHLFRKVGVQTRAALVREMYHQRQS